MRSILFLSLLPLFAQPPDYERFLTYAETIRPFTAGIANDLRWMKRSNQFWYSRTTATGAEYVIADANSAKRPAFDHARLAESLAKVKGEPVKPDRLGITGLDFKGDTLTYSSGAARYETDLTSYTTKVIPAPGPRPRLVRRSARHRVHSAHRFAQRRPRTVSAELQPLAKSQSKN